MNDIDVPRTDEVRGVSRTLRTTASRNCRRLLRHPGEVLVKTLVAGICASDIKCYHGAPLFWGDADRPAYCQPPVTPGHEFVGEVVALGEGAGEHSGLAVGDIGVRADRAVRPLSVLPQRPLLDVPAA